MQIKTKKISKKKAREMEIEEELAKTLPELEKFFQEQARLSEQGNNSNHDSSPKPVWWRED